MVDVCYRMDFFNQLQDFIEEKEKRKSTLTQICKSVTLETYKKGDFVFKEHDTDCNKAYVIVRGEVAIVKMYARIELGLTQTASEQPKIDHNKIDLKLTLISPRNYTKVSNHPSGSKGSSAIQSPRRLEKISMTPNTTFSNHLRPTPQKDTLPSPKLTLNSPMLENTMKAEMFRGMDTDIKKAVLIHGNLIVRLRYGQIFGQYALQNNDPRSASVIAADHLSLMVIDKKEFDIIKDFYSTEFNLRQQFLANILPRLDSTKDIKMHTKFIRSFDVVNMQKVVSFSNLGRHGHSGRQAWLHHILSQRRRVLCRQKNPIQ